MKKMKLIIIIVVVLALAGGGAFFFLKEPKAEGEKKPSAEEIYARSVDTEVITTNLGSAGNYAVVQFNLLLSTEKAKEEAEKRSPETKAAIISTIAGFSKDELIGTEGIKALEDELYKKLNEIIQDGKVERVLVTEFKLQ